MNDPHQTNKFTPFNASGNVQVDKDIENTLEAEDEKKKENTIIKFLRLNRVFRIPTISIFVILMLGIMGISAYFCWYLWLPKLWNWGFKPTTWRSILSIFGAIYLIIIPFISGYILPFIGKIIDLYLIEQEEEISNKFSKLTKGQKGIEVELEKNDKDSLIPLIRYSRLQLEAYYSIGLDQTHRSFRYSIVAMWIGFVVIISGIGINYLPTSIRESFSVNNIQDISVASGAIIEAISALFLWVYRSSIKQLTYFYNRQMDNHNVLICQRIAESMTNSDEPKKLMIEKILERGQKAETNGLKIPGITKIAKPQ